MAAAIMGSPGNETIAAIATGSGGGIGIVRVSGPQALTVGARIFRVRGGRSLQPAPPLHLLLGTVVEPLSGEEIDEAFAVHMHAGCSYTGEPTVEIQCHGGRGVLDAVLQAALGAGARLATPGEFTKRAFCSGRIDLAQAEAVGELIAAKDAEARRSALSRLQGGLGERVRRLKERLLDHIAAGEVILDHGEDEAAGFAPNGVDIESLARELKGLISLGERRDRRSWGARIVIAGRTNSGKSSIFNMLCNNERSIVSPLPGTTRDFIEQDSPIQGNLVTLVDTAGLRETLDPVEMEGIRRSRKQALEADLLILTIDGSLPLDQGDVALIDEFRERAPFVVVTKADLPQRIDQAQLQDGRDGIKTLRLSTIDGQGCSELAGEIAERCREEVVHGEGATPNLRHREALGVAVAFLEEAARLLTTDRAPLDQVVTELRWAMTSLCEITGETAGEEIVDRIFSRFCLGK